MRPFKFFFLASIGVIILYNVAKIVLVAVFIASILSLIYLGVKTLFDLFSGKSFSRATYGGRIDNEDFGFNYLDEHPILSQRRPVNAPWENEKIIIIK